MVGLLMAGIVGYLVLLVMTAIAINALYPIVIPIVFKTFKFMRSGMQWVAGLLVDRYHIS